MACVLCFSLFISLFIPLLQYEPRTNPALTRHWATHECIREKITFQRREEKNGQTVNNVAVEMLSRLLPSGVKCKRYMHPVASSRLFLLQHVYYIVADNNHSIKEAML